MRECSVPLFVGIDYHQRSVQVCVVDGQGRVMMNRRLACDPGRVIASVQGHGEVRTVALESCCGAADFAQRLVDQAGWDVRLSHPGYVNRMKNNRDKTDHADARLLADLCRVGYLPEVWLAPKPIRQLRGLVRHRQQLMQQQRAVKTRILAVLRDRRLTEPGQGGRWSRTWVRWLREQAKLQDHDRWVVEHLLKQLQEIRQWINEAKQRLEEATAEDPIVQRLLTLPGIGPVTAWTMRAAIGRFDRFRTGKQLARFCGVTPRNASSGERVADAGLIKAGDPQLKATLVQAAHRLKRFDRRWSELAGRLKAAGKASGVITAAIANRWMRWLFHQMTTGQPAT